MLPMSLSVCVYACFHPLPKKYNFRASEPKPEWMRKSEGEKVIVRMYGVIEKH